jgi:hypothetical protein
MDLGKSQIPAPLKLLFFESGYSKSKAALTDAFPISPTSIVLFADENLESFHESQNLDPKQELYKSKQLQNCIQQCHSENLLEGNDV